MVATTTEGNFYRIKSEEESSHLDNLLAEYHNIFSLEDERGETDLVEFKIDTGDACPKRQAARRIPFAAQQEIADQLEKMHRNSVINARSLTRVQHGM